MAVAPQPTDKSFCFFFQKEALSFLKKRNKKLLSERVKAGRIGIALAGLVWLAMASCARAQSVLSLSAPPCGGVGQTRLFLRGPVAVLPNGDRGTLLARVRDAGGQELTVYCRSGFFGSHYEYWAGFPDGTWRKIDECELDENEVTLEVTGGAAEVGTSDGVKITRVAGAILRYRHVNRDERNEFRAEFDFATRAYRREDVRGG